MQLAIFENDRKTKEPLRAMHIDIDSLSKVYYTITEVAALFQVNASMLRFWEKEFPHELAHIKKNKKGDRYYTKQNIQTLQTIIHLTKEKKLTLEGARTYFKNEKIKPTSQLDILQQLESVKLFLTQLKESIIKNESN